MILRTTRLICWKFLLLKMEYNLGIDLGSSKYVTASSLASEPMVVTVDANHVSNRSTPSIVTFDGRRRLVGEEAEARCNSLLTNTAMPAILPSERFHSTCGLQGDLVGPFDFNGSDDVFQTRAQIIAAVLNHRLTMIPDTKPVNVSIAIPAWFTPQNIAEVADACEICGIAEISTIVPAASAALVNYANKEASKTGTFLFVDVGYSQTSATLVNLTTLHRLAKLSPEDADSVSTDFTTTGVFDMIESLAEHVTKKKPLTDKKSKRYAKLRAACQKSLTQLSMLPDTHIDLAHFYENGDDLTCTLTREWLETACTEIVGKVKQVIKAVMGDRTIDGVEVIGGGSRIPFIQKAIQEASGVSNLGRGLDGSSVGAGLFAAGKRLIPAIQVDASLRASPEKMTALKAQEASIRKTHDDEVERLAVRNDLEGYLYQVKDWLSGSDREKLNPSVIEPELEKVFAWVEEKSYDDETTLIEYRTEFENFKSLVGSKGRAFFEAKDQKREKLEADLERNARETVKPEKQELDMRLFTKADRIRKAIKNKEEGNEVFKAGNLTEAVTRYNRAIQYGTNIADLSEDDKREIDAVLLSCHLNLCQCLIKASTTTTGTDKDAFLRKAMFSADDALRLDPKSIKGLYRKALCFEGQGRIDDATKAVTAGLAIAPEDADLLRLSETLKKAAAKEAEKAKKVF
jgi:tetratricopeptide (TPR) repeat protein